MQVLVVGSGKLATELLGEVALAPPLVLRRWADGPAHGEPALVVHAGSGRELDAVLAFCATTGSPLIELATGSRLESAASSFPVLVCPNTNILMLKFMHMLARSGQLFSPYRVEITESHQAEKRSAPGTAIALAKAFGLPASAIVSVRDAETQMRTLAIPPQHLGRHAVHRIEVKDGACQIAFETRVYGASPYADGVARIVAAVRSRSLENRVYWIDEFVERGWL